MNNRIFVCMLILLSTLCVPIWSTACTKPVFRYALERWPALPFPLTVIGQGEVTDELADQVKSLVPAYTENMSFDYLDVDDEETVAQLPAYWTENPDPSRLPLAVLQMPESSTVIWKGALSPDGLRELKNLIYPPVIRETLRGISQGDSAVWILIKGGDEEANAGFRSFLERNLKVMEAITKLPHELDPTDTEYDDDLAPGVPFRLGFPLIETDFRDPELALLKDMLEASIDAELDLQEPLVMPVFARGRALSLFTAEDLDTNVMAEVCQFLAGPCSCRVKELNPGFDLLMPYPWERVLWDSELNNEDLLRSLAPPTPAEEAGLEPFVVPNEAQFCKSCNSKPLIVVLVAALMIFLATQLGTKGKK